MRTVHREEVDIVLGLRINNERGIGGMTSAIICIHIVSSYQSRELFVPTPSQLYIQHHADSSKSVQQENLSHRNWHCKANISSHTGCSVFIRISWASPPSSESLIRYTLDGA
jgi:hypothetical protein